MKANLVLILLFSVIVQGCKKENLCNCLESTGKAITQKRMLNSFNMLEMDNNIDIILTPDTVEFAEITCGKNLVDGIKTEVAGNTLLVSNINKCNWLRDFENKFTVNLHFKSLRHISYTGSGNLTCADTVRENYLSVESWNGTGNLSFLLNSNEVYLKLHTGPADMEASGIAGTIYLYTAGNGFIKTGGLHGDYIYVETRSTGDCEVFPEKELGVTIKYNGNVYYKGNPEVITKNISGSGRLIPYN